MIKMPTIKFGICIYYRIVSQVSFIFFNLLFAVCYVLDVYFPVVNICKADYLGYAFIVSMGIVIVLEFVELITELLIDSIRLIKRVLLKVKV